MSYSRSTTSAKYLKTQTDEGGNNKWIRARLVEEDRESRWLRSGVTESKRVRKGLLGYLKRIKQTNWIIKMIDFNRIYIITL